MRSIRLLVTLLALSCSVSWAQKAFIYNSLQKNGFVSVSIGSSLPVGDFGRLSVYPETANKSGLAVAGRVWSVSAGYRLAGPLGLMARYNAVQNGVQPDALANLYPQLAVETVRAVTPGGHEGQWQSRSLLLGPFLTVPLGRFTLDIRALGGQAWAICPETCVLGTVNAVETVIRSDNQTSTAIIGGLGLSLRYRLTPIFALHTSADYNSASFRFNDIPLETRTGDVIQTSSYTTQRTLRMVNLSAGLTLQFRSKNQVF